MGIDRQRIVDNFYPAGSIGGLALHAVRHPRRLRGRGVVRVRPGRGQEAAGRGRLPGRLRDDLSYRDVVRGYLPEPGVVAQDIQAQLKENLGIKAKIVVMESGAFLDAANAGKLAHPPAGLGRRLSGPDQLPGLPLRHRRATKQFGAGFQDIWDVLKKAALADRPGRAQQAVRQGQRPGQAARADDPGGARRLGHGLQGRRDGRALPARWATSTSP